MRESLLVETLDMARKIWPVGDVGIYVTIAPPSGGMTYYTCQVLQDGLLLESVVDGPLVENAINAMWNQLRIRLPS